VGKHGENPSENIIAIIPARYSSTRLEGKLLLDLNGKPLIIHTCERAQSTHGISRVIVATDDERIARAAASYGFEAKITSSNHQSGSDRIAEVAESLEPESIIVNVQGDEPLISPATIDKAIQGFIRSGTEIATTSEKIQSIGDVLSPDVVKVVTDEHGDALYFSRAPIPFPREAVKEFGSLEIALREVPGLISTFRKHTGLYVYRREFLLRYTKRKQSPLEKLEMLEQLRALEMGARIRVVETKESSIGVDTKQDYERAKMLMNAEK
jgi:3-deoxy-manno-octulosonate cytidylyltransferase (CMP-KDO synthetase)